MSVELWSETRIKKTIKKTKVSHALVLSVFLHVSLFAIAAYQGYQLTSEAPPPAQPVTIEATLFQAPRTLLPYVEAKVPAKTKSKESPPTPETSRSEPEKKKPTMKTAKISEPKSNSFDELLEKASQAVSEGADLDLEETIIDKANSVALPQDSFVQTVIDENESFDNLMLDDLSEMMPEKAQVSVSQESVLAIDPIVAYKQKIGMLLQRNLRLPSKHKSGSCVLSMELSRDGLVLNTAYISGSRKVCAEAERAAIRVGKLPMPDDNDLYNELNELQISVVGAGRKL